jgi:hypothetical protein
MFPNKRCFVLRTFQVHSAYIQRNLHYELLRVIMNEKGSQLNKYSVTNNYVNNCNDFFFEISVGFIFNTSESTGGEAQSI